MINKGYVQAFTVLEAVVSMAVSAILLSLIYVVFSITSQRLVDFKTQNEEINDINRICYSITKAIFENNKMAVNENELEFKNYVGESTKYIFSEKESYRVKQDFVDTFRIKIKKIKIDTLSNSSKKQVFQRLKFKVVNEEEELELNFYKKIYAGEIITF